jgi:hypothetical protein
MTQRGPWAPSDKETPMTIHTHIRTLAAAALLALTMAGTFVGHVNAEQKEPVDNGVRCAAWTGEEWDFYLPGEVITVRDSNGVGHRRQCGADGEWHPARLAPLTGVRLVLPLSGGVLALP